MNRHLPFDVWEGRVAPLSLRHRLEAEVERLIALLDMISRSRAVVKVHQM